MKFTECARIFCTFASLLAILAGMLIVSMWPWTLKYIIRTQITSFTNTSKMFEGWEKIPYPFVADIYLFNWTNPEDIDKPGVKPILQEVGPYSFIEYKEKKNLTWNENGTLTYSQMSTWYFDEENSARNLSDIITTINVIALSSAHTVRNEGYFTRKGLSVTLGLTSPNISVTKTAREFLFEGYEDDLVSIAKKFLKSMPNSDRVGWFYMRNASTEYDGVQNMGTGASGTEYGKIYQWNYKDELPYEGSCSTILGSSGLFEPDPPKTKIMLFSPDLCKDIVFDYVEDVLVHGIVGRKYSVGISTFDNGTQIPENKCFCNGQCLPSGVLNISACRYDTPAFSSLPHFYKADPYYINAVEGLQPDPEKHEFFMTIEPITGIPLEVAGRFQGNFLMHPVKYVSMFENVNEVMFPVLWYEQKMKIRPIEADQLKILFKMTTIINIIGIVLICVGTISLCCIFYRLRKLRESEKNSQRSYFQEQHVPLTSIHQKRPKAIT